MSTVMSTPGREARLERLGIGLFLVALWLPLVLFLVLPRADVSQTENRRLAEPPRLRLTLQGLRKLPAQWDAYFADHFGLRELLVFNYARISVQVLGVSPHKLVILGKDGWVFYRGELAESDIDVTYRGLRPLTAANLERIRQAFEQKARYLHHRGIAYLLVIAPDKQTIYPEYLPDGLRARRPPSRLDQFLAYLKAKSDLQVVDLRPVLLAAKTTYPRSPTFYQTDSHWNDLGALLAHREIVRRLAEQLPGLRSPDTGVVEGQRSETASREIGTWFGMQNWLLERNAYSVPWKGCGRLSTEGPPPGSPAQWSEPINYGVAGCDSGSGPRAVVFRDSFFDALVQFLSSYFSRMVYVRQRDFDAVLVASEHPDVVIDQIVERNLFHIPDAAVVVRSSAGPVAQPDAQLAATAARATSSMSCHIDAVVNAAGPKSARIQPRLGVSVVGWAATDVQQGTLPAQVILELSPKAPGQTLFVQAQRFPRPDVAKSFGNPALVNSGLVADFSFGAASAGSYRIVILQVDGDGPATRCLSDATLDVAPPLSADLALEGRLTGARVVSSCGIDVVADARQVNTDVLPREFGMAVSGWLADLAARDVEGRAYVTLTSADGARRFFAPAESLQRPDVAAHFKRPELIRSGFHAETNLSGIPAGRYRIGAMRVNAHGSGEVCPPSRWIEVR